MLLIAVSVNGQNVYVDTSMYVAKPFPFEYTFSKVSIQMPFDYIYQEAQKKDSDYVQQYQYLLAKGPSADSYDEYYYLGCSLWHLNRLEEAKRIFQVILSSKAGYYTDTYYHSSDVSGDTSHNLYGYGSYTSSYKNGAAIYLAKICLLQERYPAALKYTEDAKFKYKVRYTCGTGSGEQHREYDYLYGRCYEGLKRYKDAMELLLPKCLERRDEIIVRVIRNQYSARQIDEYLKKAEASITFVADTAATVGYWETLSSETNILCGDTVAYYSGTGTIMLFGKELPMQVPTPERNGRVKRDDLISAFKQSSFYRSLREQ